MKVLSKEVFNQIRRWVYLYARPIEMANWEYNFESGSKEAIIKVISFFQNKDGGFSGFDPDCSNPESSPWSTLNGAYDMLVNLGCGDKSNPIIQGIMRYVANTDHFNEQGWYWAVPSNNNYPCEDYMRFPNSPWFPHDWPPSKINNGNMSRFVLEHFDKEDEVYKKTLRMLEYRISIMPTYADFCKYANTIEQGMEAWDWAKLINNLRDFGIKSGEEYERIASDFLKIVESSLKDETVLNEIRYWKNNNGSEYGGDPKDIDFDAIIDKLSSGNKWNDNGLLDKTRNDITSLKVGELWWPIIEVIDNLNILKKNNRLEI